MRSAETLVVMGVAGSGKSTVGRLLAEELQGPFAEGDDFHSDANVAKMRAGVPLTDADRQAWLVDLRNWIAASHESGRSSVASCSALRRNYRDVLRSAPGVVAFVQLDVDRAVLESRMAARVGHFMPASLLDSQLETLEPLDTSEDGIIVSADGAPKAAVAEIIRRLALA